MLRVQQEHQYGCQVAVLAMLLKCTYKEALSYYSCDPDSCKGFTHITLDNILAECGYAVARMHSYARGNKPRVP